MEDNDSGQAAVTLNGMALLTVAEAAERLGIGRRSIFRLCEEGRLNYLKRGKLRYVLEEDVESYARLQQIWRDSGGRWTPYGRLPRVQNRGARGFQEPAPAEPPEPASPPNPGEDMAARYWVTASQAAEMLDLTLPRVHQLARARNLERATGLRPPGEPLRRIVSHKGRPPVWLRLSDVLDMQNRGDRRSPTRKPSDHLGQWMLGWTRTKLEAPPGDRLITRSEAAAILGVSCQRVGELVITARLFAWQTRPGRPGSKLFLSENQVNRYAADPARLKRREAHQNPRTPEHNDYNHMTESERWADDHRLFPEQRFSRRPNIGRDYGEYYALAQAARILGITTAGVRHLVHRGRLAGRRLKRSGGPTNRQWWFVRKEDLNNLAADPAYRRHSRAIKQANTPEARAARATTAFYRSLGLPVPDSETG